MVDHVNISVAFSESIKNMYIHQCHAQQDVHLVYFPS